MSYFGLDMAKKQFIESIGGEDLPQNVFEVGRGNVVAVDPDGDEPNYGECLVCRSMKDDVYKFRDVPTCWDCIEQLLGPGKLSLELPKLRVL
jgi:hypothetical protein